MSYILDALRKSETERRQGRVPDLGQQVQLIHRPRKKRVSAAAWVALALMLNAGVLAFIFWPGGPLPLTTVEQIETPPVSEPAPVVPDPEPITAGPEASQASAAEDALEGPLEDTAEDPVIEQQPAASPRERATVIVPSSAIAETRTPLADPGQAGRVPHLVELPLSFQKSVPDLTFNSHIYSSSPASSRVMINNAYLRVGDTFEGLRVEDITEQGVVLSRNGRRFRVGVVRDWVSPR